MNLGISRNSNLYKSNMLGFRILLVVKNGGFLFIIYFPNKITLYSLFGHYVEQ